MKPKVAIVIVGAIALIGAVAVGLFCNELRRGSSIENFVDLPASLSGCEMHFGSRDSFGDDAGYSAIFVCDETMDQWNQTFSQELSSTSGWSVDQDYLDMVEEMGLADKEEVAYIKVVDGKATAHFRGGPGKFRGEPKISFRFKQLVDEDD